MLTQLFLPLIRPQFNEAVWSAAEKESKSVKAQEDEDRIIAFLDQSLAKYGRNSAAYIR